MLSTSDLLARLAAAEALALRESARADKAERAARLQRLELVTHTALPNLTEQSRSPSSRSLPRHPLDHLTQLPPRSGVDGALPGFPTAAVEGAVCHAVLRAMRRVPRPSAASAHELELHHPYHQRLLSEIEVAARGFGCATLKAHAEARVADSAKRPDFAFTQRNEQQALHANLCALLEVKPGSRKGQSGAALAREGVAQAIGYLAQRQLACADLPTQGVALVSVGSARLWVVRIDFASAAVPVTLSEELPLLGGDDVDGGTPTAAAVGDDDNDDSHAPAIPAGLRALVRLLLACSDTALFGLQRVVLPLELGGGWENRGLLGSGGFADVVRLSSAAVGGGGGVEVAGKFVRLSAFDDYLQTEKDVLLTLGSHSVPNVPRVHQCEGADAPFLRVEGRSVLLTAPVGAPLSATFEPRSDASLRARRAARMLSQVRAALAGAHAAGYAHGDVRPSNIVGVAAGSSAVGEGDVDFVLIDWGLAAPVAHPPRRKRVCGERAYMSERMLLLAHASQPSPSLAATPDDDLEAAMWAFFAAVEGSCARAPWDQGDFFLPLEVVAGRREWVREHAAALHAAAVELPEEDLRASLAGAIGRYSEPLPA